MSSHLGCFTPKGEDWCALHWEEGQPKNWPGCWCREESCPTGNKTLITVLIERHLALFNKFLCESEFQHLSLSYQLSKILGKRWQITWVSGR